MGIEKTHIDFIIKSRSPITPDNQRHLDALSSLWVSKFAFDMTILKMKTLKD